jgi:hypothetical protein
VAAFCFCEAILRILFLEKLDSVFRLDANGVSFAEEKNDMKISWRAKLSWVIERVLRTVRPRKRSGLSHQPLASRRSSKSRPHIARMLPVMELAAQSNAFPPPGSTLMRLKTPIAGALWGWSVPFVSMPLLRSLD